jgi:type I restriction enzyme R subunit
LEQLPPTLLALGEDELARQDAATQFLVRAHPHLPRLRQLEFAAVVSGGHNDNPQWKTWTDKTKTKQRITDFKKPFVDPAQPAPGKQSNLAFLCVKSMLLTGFDAPFEQVLYLDRVMRGHELLQAIARVNRTGPEKHCGYVVDYVGVARHLTEALAVYSAEDVQGAMTSIVDELPVLSDRHRRVLAVFHDRGIADISQVDDCVALLRDEKIRAEFVVKFKRFLESLNVVMPRPEGLPYTRDAKILGFINQAAANMYRDSQLNIAGVGHKVRRLIDDHVQANGIDPKVPPISIMDADFEQVVATHVSSRAKASEMEHAARHHISVHFNSDPVYYKKLSRRLEEILQQFHDDWDDLATALQPLIREIRQGRPEEEVGLDPTLRAFRDVLAEEVPGDSARSPEELAEVTAEMLTQIGKKIRRVDFWRNTHAQTELRSSLVLYLDDNDLVELDRQEAVADQLVEMAKHHHQRLTTQ